ncbi:MAG: rRNA ((2251)-2-O)-methyltransferase RlmB [Cyanobacteriota bacterium]
MSPRFDRRRDQGQGSGAGEGRYSRPGRGPARGGSRPFAPRGEWRPEGGDRPARGDRPERGERPLRGGERPGRPERPFRGERSGPSDRKPFARRGERRFEAPRADAPRRDSVRPDGARFGGSRPERRPERRPGRPGPRPQGRAPFQPRPPFDDRRGDRAPQVAIDVSNAAPSGESERFGAAPADDLIWGRHSAQAALESERPIHRIWCTPEMRFQPRFLQLLREAKAGGVLVEEVTWARLGQLTGGAVHQGIVLQVAAADTLDLDSLIDGCRDLGEPPLLMALDGITDPHNLGAIVRSAEALGAHGLVLPQRRSAGLTGSVAKVAAGALEHLPVARVVNLNRSLDQLKQEGYRVIGLAGEGSVSLAEADLEGPLVIVTGSEGAGLSMLTRKHCDQLVRIPLRGSTPSLNASVATAMVLYEVARRGWMKQLSGNAPAPRIVRPAMPAPPAVTPTPTPEPDPELELDLEPMVELEPLAPLASEPVAEAQPPAEPEPEQPPALVLGLEPALGSSFSTDIQL